MTKASELDKGLRLSDPSAPDDEDRYYYIPRQRVPVYDAYKKVGQLLERTGSDRTWDWWISLVTADPVKDQQIVKSIPQLYRIKDSDGKEWLFYNVDLSGRDWKGNRKDFNYIEGVIEGMPEFHYEIDPSTQKVISGTTQVQDVTRKYTIPFTKAKVEELSKHFRVPLSCIIVAPDGRKHSCSLQEFRDSNYDELIDLKTGFSEYMLSRRRGQLKEGGVK